MTGRMIVSSHSPLRRRLTIVGLSLAVVIGGWLVYEVGQTQGGFNRLESMMQRSGLQSQIEDLEKTNQGLQEHIARTERIQLVDDGAYDGVRANVKQLQEEILELREEVDFYRGIVSPVERLTGLNIQSFKIEPAGEEGLYHFNIVLTQLLKNDRIVKGVVKLYLQGVQNGEPLSLSFRDISPNKSVRNDFRFRYFQKMEGDIRVADGFVPRNILVEMSPRGRKQVSASFPWLVSGI